MAEFNPYREWLHLESFVLNSPSGRPNHYQILGLADGEPDAEKIRHAADERLNSVRRVRPGPNLDAWQKLLDELTEIRRVLMDSALKSQYDAALRNGNGSGSHSTPMMPPGTAPSLNPLPPTTAPQASGPKSEVHASPVKNLLPPTAAELANGAAPAPSPAAPASGPMHSVSTSVTAPAAASLGAPTHAALPANHAGVALPTPAGSLAAFHPEGAPVFAPAPNAGGFGAPPMPGVAAGGYAADPYAAAHQPAAPGWPNAAMQTGQFNSQAGQHGAPGYPPAPGYAPGGYGNATQYGAPGFNAPQYTAPPAGAGPYGAPQYGVGGFGAAGFAAATMPAGVMPPAAMPGAPGYGGWQQPGAAPTMTAAPAWGAPAAYPGAPMGTPPMAGALPVGMPVGMPAPMASVTALSDPMAPVASAKAAASPFDDLPSKKEFAIPEIAQPAMPPASSASMARRSNSTLPIIAVVGVGIFVVGIVAVMLSGRHGGDPQQVADANAGNGSAGGGEGADKAASGATNPTAPADQPKSPTTAKTTTIAPKKPAPKTMNANKPAVDAPAASGDNAGGANSTAADTPAPAATTNDGAANPDAMKPDMEKPADKPDMAKPDMTKPDMAKPDMAANDPAMAKPEMTAPTAKPAVAEAPTTPAAEMIRLMADAKVALSERKMDVAKEHLAKAAELAKLPDHQAMVGRLQLLSSYVAQFWTGVGQGMKTLMTSDELEVGTTRVAVISATETEITLRASGRNLHYTIDKLPSGVAEACFERARDMKDPVNRICKAAFNAVDPNRGPDKAKPMLQQAQLAGGDVADLMAAIDDKYDVSSLPAARAPVKKGHMPDSAAIAQANSTVKAKYGAQITAAKNAQQRLEIAKKLLADGQLPMENEAERYAILNEARNQAAIVRTAELIVQVVDEMDKWFPIDPMALKYDSLKTAALKANQNESRTIATELLQLADVAVEAKRSDLALNLVKIGKGAAGKAKDGELIKRAADKERELQKANKEAVAAAKGKPAAKDRSPAAKDKGPADGAKPDAAKPEEKAADAK